MELIKTIVSYLHCLIGHGTPALGWASLQITRAWWNMEPGSWILTLLCVILSPCLPQPLLPHALNSLSLPFPDTPTSTLPIFQVFSTFPGDVVQLFSHPTRMQFKHLSRPWPFWGASHPHINVHISSGSKSCAASHAWTHAGSTQDP